MGWPTHKFVSMAALCELGYLYPLPSIPSMKEIKGSCNDPHFIMKELEYSAVKALVQRHIGGKWQSQDSTWHVHLAPTSVSCA